MEKSPFKNKPVDGVHKNIFIRETKPKNIFKSQIFAKLLGVVLASILAFFLYTVYSDIIPRNSSEKEESTISNNGINQNSLNVEIPTKYIAVEVSNSNVGEKFKITSTKIDPYTDVVFEINTPSKKKLTYESNSKVFGIAEYQIPEKTLTEVGEYTIMPIAKGYETRGIQKFILRPSELSAKTSKIETSKSRNPIDTPVVITVTLLDSYGNAIKDREITLISTRPDADTIKNIETEKTGIDGKIIFEVTSNEPGKSSFLALNKETGITLNNKVDIVFDLPLEDEKEGDAGDSLSLSIFNLFIPKASAANEAAYYIINGPSDFYLGEATSVTVEVYDSSNSIVTNYLGRVKFVSNNQNSVILPEDYTFVETDKGVHDFQATFNSIGSYLLTVSATGNASIKGEKNINVIAKENSSSILKPEILSPPKGIEGKETMINNPQIDIAGKAQPNTTIEVYDDKTKLGETLSNLSGLFFFKTEPLSDGKHIFKVVSIKSSEEKNESDGVSIVIDTTNAIILKDSIKVEPNQLMPGEKSKITVKAEPNLISVKAIINNTPIVLTEIENTPGVYIGEYTASQQPGTYSVDIELTDNVTNPVTFKKQGEITISLVPQLDLPSPGNTNPGNTNIDQYQQTIDQVPPATGPAEIVLMMFLSSLIFGFVFLKN